MAAHSQRLLVIGATGMLGHQVLLHARAQDRFEAHALTRRYHPILGIDPARMHFVDARDVHSVERIISELRPKIIINCLGVVKSIAHDPLATISLNALMPHQLAAAADGVDARLVHVSTDCVFSGRRGGYSEGDEPDPVDLYGRTKLLGEVDRAPHLTVRTSFIGQELETSNGLLAWFLSQTGTVNGFVNAIWSGFVAPELARILLELAVRPTCTGLMHVAGASINKYDLLVLMQRVFDRSHVRVERYDDFYCDRSLNHQRFDELDIPVASLEAQLEEIAR